MGWDPPKDSNGKPLPLRESASFPLDLAVWVRGRDEYLQGGTEELLAYEDYAGRCPSKEDYFPGWGVGDCNGIIMLKNGRPVSPVMRTPRALAQWLATNPDTSAYSIHEWEAKILKDLSYPPTLVDVAGNGYITIMAVVGADNMSRLP